MIQYSQVKADEHSNYEALFRSLLKYNNLKLLEARKYWSHGDHRFFVYADFETEEKTSMNGGEPKPLKSRILVHGDKGLLSRSLGQMKYLKMLFEDFLGNVVFREEGYSIPMHEHDWKLLFDEFVYELRDPGAPRNRALFPQYWYNDRYGTVKIKRPTAFDDDSELELRLAIAGC